MSGFRPWTRPPALRVGERVRLAPGGPVYTVSRVTPCAAYLARREPRTFMATDKVTGEQHEVTAAVTRVEAVSVRAFVYREEV